MANNMSRLLDRIEMRLGTRAINLPDDIAKSTWADPEKGPISLMTIPDFSHLFPHKITITLENAPKKGEYYILDEASGFPEGTNFIGVRDIDWEAYQNNPATGGLYGVYGMYQTNYSVQDLMLQAASNHVASAFSSANTIYIEFKEPNLIALKTVSGMPLRGGFLPTIPVDVFIEHSLNLATIPVSQSHAFFELAVCDVASYLYEYLKYYDGTPTIFADVDLKLDTIRSVADTRETIYQQLDDAHVSASNSNQPFILTI